MNRRAETDVDVVILVGTLGIVLLALFLLSPFWGYFGLSFIAALGTWEAISKIRSGRTLTQRFKRVMASDKRWIAVFAITALDIFFIYLNIHLLLSIGIFR